MLERDQDNMTVSTEDEYAYDDWKEEESSGEESSGGAKKVFIAVIVLLLLSIVIILLITRPWEAAPDIPVKKDPDPNQEDDAPVPVEEDPTPNQEDDPQEQFTIWPWKNGPSDKVELELKQGSNGNCYILSSLVALSQTVRGRTFLSDMVSLDESTGNVSVRFDAPKLVSAICPETQRQKIDERWPFAKLSCPDLPGRKGGEKRQIVNWTLSAENFHNFRRQMDKNLERTKKIDKYNEVYAKTESWGVKIISRISAALLDRTLITRSEVSYNTKNLL